MKKVRTRIAMLGYPSCSILEVDDDDAASLISGGFAEPSSGPAVNVAQAEPEAELEPAPELETADEPAATETADEAPAPARKPAARKPRKPSSSSS